MPSILCVFFASLLWTQVACLYVPPPPSPGCPPIRPGDIGTCVANCGPQRACPPGQICCPSPCGGLGCAPDPKYVGPVPIPVPACPRINPGDVGICGFTCRDSRECAPGRICCPTACGGTSCALPEPRDERCPVVKLPPGLNTICLVRCTPGSCPAGLICCSVGCSRQCVKPKKPKVIENTCQDIKCQPGEICAFEIVICKKPPCPPKPMCVPNDCSAILCLVGTLCVPRIPDPGCVGLGCGSSVTCADNPCTGFRCPQGQQCEAVPVKCTRGPCVFNPVATCVPVPDPKPGPIPVPDPACPPAGPAVPGICAFTCGADLPCDPGRICCPTGCGGTSCVLPEKKDVPEVIKNTCKEDTCKAGQVCVLQEVTCIRAPCPPLPSCVPDPCLTVRCPRRCLTVPIVCKIGEKCNPEPVCVSDPCEFTNCLIGPCVPEPVPCEELPCRAELIATCPGPQPQPPVVNTCNTQNKQCEPGEVCALEMVLCPTSPCPPNPICVHNDCSASPCLSGQLCVPQILNLVCIRAPCHHPSVCVDDPCKGFTCPGGEMCEAAPVVCTDKPCVFKPVATCVPIPAPKPLY